MISQNKKIDTHNEKNTNNNNGNEYTQDEYGKEDIGLLEERIIQDNNSITTSEDTSIYITLSSKSISLANQSTTSDYEETISITTPNVELPSDRPGLTTPINPVITIQDWLLHPGLEEHNFDRIMHLAEEVCLYYLSCS